MAEPVHKRPRTTPSRLGYLRTRELGNAPPTAGAYGTPQHLRTWVEGETLRKLDTGEYVSMDKTSTLVRSTISIALSHDGRYFASTHGDHSVKVFEYPSRRQIACLDGHPRTPWTVRFHPSDSNILASGCLGNECRIWDVQNAKCVRKHTFGATISCVSFAPSGDALAVTSGRSLLLWYYQVPTPDGTIFTRAPVDGPEGQPLEYDMHLHPSQQQPKSHLPIQLLSGNNPFHMVDFHPSGHMLMTGEKNRANNDARDQDAPEEQFTLRLVVHRFDRRLGVKFADPVLIVPRVVAYNDAGIHFSPCGKLLAACVPREPKSQEFSIAVMAMTPVGDNPIGTVLHKVELGKGHVTALTNLRFSSTSRHLLAGFSFRPQNPVLRTVAERFDEMGYGVHLRTPGFASCGAPLGYRNPQMPVVDIYALQGNIKKIRSLNADMDISEDNIGGAEDEINVAVFAPRDGIADGIIYGTQKGRIRMFQQASGRKSYPPGICGKDCVLTRLSLPYLLPPVTVPVSSSSRNIGVWATYPSVTTRVATQMANPHPRNMPPQSQHQQPAPPLPLPTLPPLNHVEHHTQYLPHPVYHHRAQNAQPPPPIGNFFDSSFRRHHAYPQPAPAATPPPPPPPPPLNLHLPAPTAPPALHALPPINIDRDVNIHHGPTLS